MEELLAELHEVPDAEKGDRGKIGVIAGSAEKAGPPALAGQAALRTGSDLVRVLTSERVLDVVAGYSENLTVGQYVGDDLSTGSLDRANELADWSDALVIGPGLGEPDGVAVRRIVEEASIPLVVDASAISPAMEEASPETVFTPDSAEAARIEEAYGGVERFAERTGAVVVSTGSTDVIYDGGDRWTNETGTPALTVGGTGDVLAGVVVSLIGQKLDLHEAARLGAWTLGTAGERAAGTYGIGVTATDVVEEIPAAIAAGRS